VKASPTAPTTILVQPSAQNRPRSDLYAVFSNVDVPASGPLHVTSWNQSPPSHRVTVTVPATLVDFFAFYTGEIRGGLYAAQQHQPATGDAHRV